MVRGLVSTSGTSDAVTKPLWAPWRLEYIQSVDDQPGCVFCLAQEGEDEETLVVHRGELAFALLNRFPYSSGHFMVAPYRHVGVYGELTDDEVLEIHRLAAQGIEALGELYKPDGHNLGWNLGRVAGAGRGRPRAPARRPSLGGRHELHAGARRREGDARAPGGDASPPRRRLAELVTAADSRDSVARGNRLSRLQRTPSRRSARSRSARPVRDSRLPRSLGRPNATHVARGLGLHDHRRGRRAHRLVVEGAARLPSETITVDIHCVTKWSKLDTQWEGVSLDTLLADVETSAEYAVAFCDGGYTTNLPLGISRAARRGSRSTTTVSHSTRSTAARRGCSCRTSTSGRARSGCAAYV